MEIITTHKNVDFDALASVFAASFLYPGAVPVLPQSLNPNIRAFLSIHKELFPFKTPKQIDPSVITKLIVVDTNSWDRLDGMSALRDKKDLEIILWDHHNTKGDICPAWSCCEHVGATVSMFVRKLADENTPLSPIQATLFIAGIYEDTGNMTFPATSALDAKAVSFLLEQGADLSFIGSFLRPIYGPRQKDLLFEMLKSAERRKISGHTISINTVAIEGHTPGLALVVNMYQDIMNVTAAFGIFSDKTGRQRIVIGRSSGENVDVGVIMRTLGGGGHLNAGSAMLKSVDPVIIEKRIVACIQGEHPVSVQISDLMSFPVFTLSPEITMKKAALLLRDKGCTGLPVVDGNTLVGILSRRDFNRMRKTSQIEAPVKSFMSRNVHHIHPRTPVGEAARLMVKEDIGRLPVIEGGRLVGIVTRTDVMGYYYDLLPGELSHESPAEAPFLPD